MSEHEEDTGEGSSDDEASGERRSRDPATERFRPHGARSTHDRQPDGDTETGGTVSVGRRTGDDRRDGDGRQGPENERATRRRDPPERAQTRETHDRRPESAKTGDDAGPADGGTETSHRAGQSDTTPERPDKPSAAPHGVAQRYQIGRWVPRGQELSFGANPTHQQPIGPRPREDAREDEGEYEPQEIPRRRPSNVQQEEWEFASRSDEPSEAWETVPRGQSPEPQAQSAWALWLVDAERMEREQ